MTGIEILGTGSYAPPKAVSNDDLSKIMDTSDEWVSSRTGIRRRHYAEGEMNIDMAAIAGAKAIEAAGIKKEDIAVCIFSTFTPDTMTPTMSCTLQGELGLPNNILALDINGACAGFIYGLSVVKGLLAAYPGKYALLVGSEIISQVLDFEDRATAVLFGDAAGAVVVGLKEDAPFYFTSGVSCDKEVIRCAGIYGANQGELPAVVMNGKEVFRFAVDIIPRCIKELLAASGLELDDVDHIICHQANERIISHVYKKLKQPSEKFYMNLQEYGNTSSASIPLVLDEMSSKGLLKPGMKIMCVGFGAGLSWGGALFQW